MLLRPETWSLKCREGKPGTGKGKAGIHTQSACLQSLDFYLPPGCIPSGAGVTT